MIHGPALLTITLMAIVTYATRVLGYVALSNRTLSPRTKAMLDAAPPCVLLAVIAPTFVTTRLADLVALAIIVIAAVRLPMLATVVIAIGVTAFLRLAMT